MLVVQSCPTLWDPMAYSPPGSFIRKILQARILEWVAGPKCIFSKQTPWCWERLKARGEGGDRMRWLDGITDSGDMSLRELREIVKVRKSGMLTKSPWVGCSSPPHCFHSSILPRYEEKCYPGGWGVGVQNSCGTQEKRVRKANGSDNHLGTVQGS